MKKKPLEYEKPVLHTLMQGMGMDVATGVKPCRTGSSPSGACDSGTTAASDVCSAGGNASTGCSRGAGDGTSCGRGTGFR